MIRAFISQKTLFQNKARFFFGIISEAQRKGKQINNETKI